MSFKKVVVAGGGVLGSQIAFQAAYCGFDVTIWLRSEGSITRTQPKLDNLKKVYLDTIEEMSKLDAPTPGVWAPGIADFASFNKAECIAKTERAYLSIKLELNMSKAAGDADVIIESMAENPEDKIAFYTALAPLMPEKTVLLTNSSTLLPSMFAKYTGRPEKYLSLHFANSIWRNNTAEVMVQSETEEKYFEETMQFAREIRMLPLPLKKEKAGYLLNSMLVPLLFSGLDLYADGISDFGSIDIAWMRGAGAPKGPFMIMDVVGLTTIRNIVHMYTSVPAERAPYHYKAMEEVIDRYIAEGKLGKSVGEGFYKYDDKGNPLM